MSKSGQTILPIAYDGDSNYDPSLTSGENFSCKNKRFMILSSKSIPKRTKAYCEVTIRKCNISNNKVRHIPIYVGVMKEPSYGYMASDLCLGSVYYCNKYEYTGEDWKFPINIQSIERFKQSVDFVKSNKNSVIDSKIPKLNTVIGIGVDMVNNTITIYTDGKKFYSFSPTKFNLNTDTADFYFCLVFPLDKDNNIVERMSYPTDISGVFNFGRVRMTYLPTGYWTLYQEYYTKEETSKDITCTVKHKSKYGGNIGYKEVPIKFLSKNPYEGTLVDGHRAPVLVYATGSKPYTTNKTLKIVDTAEDSAYFSLPCPTDQKVYFEVTTKEASLIAEPDGTYEIVGVPISVGISKSKSNFLNAFWVNLFHRKHTPYNSYYHSGAASNANNGPYSFTALNPIAPVQPQTVGVIVDLAHNEIDIITDGEIFAKVPIKGNDYSVFGGEYYIFIKGDLNLFTGTGYSIVDFGEDKDSMAYSFIPDNKEIMTFYYYWNYLIKTWLDEDGPTFPVYLDTIPYKIEYNRTFRVTVRVPSDDQDRGINRLWDNTILISDIETKNHPKTKSSLDLQADLKNEKSTNVR